MTAFPDYVVKPAPQRRLEVVHYDSKKKKEGTR